MDSVKIALDKTNTFTKTLSRWQIEEIAKKLPPKSAWKNGLSIIKQQIIDDYGLSSHEFSETLNIIKNHREFCVYIGMEIQFENFSDSSIENYIKYVNGILDDNDICKLLSFDDYILLLTFLELSKRECENRFLYFSEQLDSIYNDYKERLLTPKPHDFFILKNNYSSIIQGMERCGQQAYIAKLQKQKG